MASLEISDLEEVLREAQKAATQAQELADWAQKVADDALKNLRIRRTAAIRFDSGAHSSSRDTHRSRTPGRSRSSSPSSGLHPLLKMVGDEVRPHDQPKQVGAWVMHINNSIEGLTAHRMPDHALLLDWSRRSRTLKVGRLVWSSRGRIVTT